MTKTQAHNSVTAKYQAGLVSLAEAQAAHRRLNQIGTGISHGQRISRKQQQALYSIWA